MSNKFEGQERLGEMTNHEAYRSWAERNGFSDWALALLWIIIAFVLFQITAAIVAMVVLVAKSGVTAMEAVKLLPERLGVLFIGNSTGQILFLGLATCFFCRLQTSKDRRTSFLRFKIRNDTAQKIALTAVLILAVQPTIWFLAWLNALIPVPDFFSKMQSTQMEMIENYLTSDHLLLITLFHVALVPALCEETLFRGYALRAFQKSWSIWPAIIVSGLIFGLYHLQLSNLIPLASLGILFAFVTWISESIYPAIVAHFINNGGSVLVGKYYPESAFAEITPEMMPSFWAVIPSLIISAYIVYWMYNRHSKLSA
ncbi:MAG TPA: CPBP family intramembrane glutamic endopeptidase [Balneolaceae bacterium]|nr:CPBP family intramembrane glutamic endopeptidase [Balneolaceae bacterium]